MATIRTADIPEIWKKIEISSKNYEVSNYGQIRNSTTKKILTPRPTKTGYLRVHLAVPEGGRKDFYIHRLVAEAFCSRKEGYDTVNHLDNDITNNYASNLEWCTQTQNIDYCQNQGRASKNRKPVIGIKDNVEYYFNSMTEAQQHTGCCVQNIGQCCRGERKTIHGYSWRYVE